MPLSFPPSPSPSLFRPFSFPHPHAPPSPLPHFFIRVVLGIALLLPVGCTPSAEETAPLDIKLYQTWELQPGDIIGEREVVGGLGDISIALNGNSVYAPFDGKTQFDKRRCLIFSSPDVPAYLFRLCGIDQPRLGKVNQGDVIGKGRLLEFAALRKQPNGTWAIVEPAKAILERTLSQP
ncbi:hypothetical protein K9N68_04680 [Kovacikia minuta CCNUW1]|uniref:hypothetical protein n=1 Tax=Kovacikia minuta TaxID=2931930 RepID=UPI001CCBA66B|nr:hypothetical protein [Kovacikia minuta]UBF27264.1 hypothetical protein K9N68_04680 [Kovacikia minuta CCNUW1]